MKEHTVDSNMQLAGLRYVLHMFSESHVSFRAQITRVSTGFSGVASAFKSWVSESNATGHTGGACWLLDGNVTEAGCHV